MVTIEFPKTVSQKVREAYEKAYQVVVSYLKYVAMFLLALMLAISNGISHVYASTPTLEVDPSGIIEGANSYIPMWTSILSTPAGLMISFAIVSLVVGAIIAAFSSVKNMW